MGRKKKNYAFEGLVIVTMGACLITTVLVGTFFYINSSIGKNQQAITALSDKLVILKEQMEDVKDKEAEYKSQLHELEAEISKYKPIVIPESMQK